MTTERGGADKELSAQVARPDHWDELASALREYVQHVPDGKIAAAYEEMMEEGWHTPPALEGKGRKPTSEFKHQLLEALMKEQFRRFDEQKSKK